MSRFGRNKGYAFDIAVYVELDHDFSIASLWRMGVEGVKALEEAEHGSRGSEGSPICRLLEPVVRLRGLRLPNKTLYSRAFELYCKTSLGFVDAYNAAFIESRGLNEVYSYDSDFDRLERISRIEPGV